MEANSKKKEILSKGAEIILFKGFNNTGINEILDAAGVPKGSFYFYFKSKADFGIQLIRFFEAQFLQLGDYHIKQVKKSYLIGLRNFFDGFLEIFKEQAYRGGCPIGNFSLEMSDLNENFRNQIQMTFGKMQDTVKHFLSAAVKIGELSESHDLDSLSEFIINSWEGALMRVKVKKDAAPMALFYDILFNQLLKKAV